MSQSLTVFHTNDTLVQLETTEETEKLLLKGSSFRYVKLYTTLLARH